MSVQSMNKPTRFLDGYDNREKNAIVVTGTLAILAFIFSFYGFFFPLNPDISYAVPTLVTAGILAVACYLVFRRRKVWGVLLSLLAVYLLSLMFIVTTEDLASTLSLTYIIIGSGISLFTLESAKMRNALIAVVLTAGSLLLIGYFSVGERFPAPPLLIVMLNFINAVLLITYIVIGFGNFLLIL